MIAHFYSEVEEYLFKRLSNPQTYRGLHLVQHQRLPQEKLAIILESIIATVGTNIFIEPSNDDPNPTGVSHKLGDARRTPPGNTSSDCDDYWGILDNIAATNVSGVGATFNSLKKNTFPNLEGMKLLKRHSSAGPLEPKTAELTELAVKFINGNIRERNRIFGECNENILKPIIDVLDVALEKFDSLNVYELMLFLTDKSISFANRINLVGKYKKLKRLQVIQLHASIQAHMSLKMGSNIPKVEKLDWHNWWNESKQITSMLNNVTGFNVYQDEQIMKSGNAAAAFFIATRSSIVKREALTWHDINGIDGWELHHIMPVEYATGSDDLRKIDEKRNMLYIPGSIHRLIPRTSNLMVSFSYDSSNVILSNPLSKTGEPSMSIAFPRNAGVKEDNLDLMVKYNRELLGLVVAK